MGDSGLEMGSRTGWRCREEIWSAPSSRHRRSQVPGFGEQTTRFSRCVALLLRAWFSVETLIQYRLAGWRGRVSLATNLTQARRIQQNRVLIAFPTHTRRRLSPPELNTDRTWTGAAITAGSGLAAFLGVGALFWRDSTALLAVGMIAGWTLCVGLFVNNAWQRRRIAQLETDLAQAQQQASHFASSAKSVADASLSAVNTIRRAEAVENFSTPPKRSRKKGEAQ